MEATSVNTCLSKSTAPICIETSSYYFHVQSVAKWLSCNGEPAGVGPTLVVASAAAVFLYHELRQSVRGGGGAGARLEKLLLSTMAVGALALLVHVWVCAARFFLYYLDTLLRESPCLLLELTTAGVLGARSEALLTPLTRFAREQQHQIHVTACWFLALCCADYVRKHYCETFNLPYLEQWQSGLQRRTSRSVRAAAEHAGSFVAGLQRRLNALQGECGEAVWRPSFARLASRRAAPRRSPGSPAPSCGTGARKAAPSPAAGSPAPASDWTRRGARVLPWGGPVPPGVVRDSSGDGARATRGTSPTPSTSLDIMSRIRDVLALGVAAAARRRARRRHPSELSQLIAEQDLDMEFIDVL
ncbi:hypothetical protein JYU34_006198 [Plutella xylostella]|uniref:Uncharacterized protein n=1 Tax=Plutella xylostella TaxID=51655 RepID=A0ABQ7QV40_PLUXY|nr:hypothetical protein JYU34_006198 [Plutella xylostella]